MPLYTEGLTQLGFSLYDNPNKNYCPHWINQAQWGEVNLPRLGQLLSNKQEALNLSDLSWLADSKQHFLCTLSISKIQHKEDLHLLLSLDTYYWNTKSTCCLLDNFIKEKCAHLTELLEMVNNVRHLNDQVQINVSKLHCTEESRDRSVYWWNRLIFNPNSFDFHSLPDTVFQGVYLHNDVVNGDVDQLHKEANEAHDGKAYCCCHGDLLELCIYKQYSH